MFIIKYLLLLTILAIGLLYYFKKGKPLAIKALCSLLVFIYAFSGSFSVSSNSAFRLFIVGGLLCCLVGDVVISNSFISGMVVFASAHICFIAGFIFVGLFFPPTMPLFVFIVLITAAFYAILKLNLIKTELKTAACLYAIIISFMTSLAVCAPMRYGLTAWSVSLSFGSVFFLVSDILLGLMTSGRVKDKMDYISLPVYYLATSLFAQSVVLINTTDVFQTMVVSH